MLMLTSASVLASRGDRKRQGTAAAAAKIAPISSQFGGVHRAAVFANWEKQVPNAKESAAPSRGWRSVQRSGAGAADCGANACAAAAKALQSVHGIASALKYGDRLDMESLWKQVDQVHRRDPPAIVRQLLQVTRECRGIAGNVNNFGGCEGGNLPAHGSSQSGAWRISYNQIGRRFVVSKSCEIFFDAVRRHACICRQVFPEIGARNWRRFHRDYPLEVLRQWKRKKPHPGVEIESQLAMAVIHDNINYSIYEIPVGLEKGSGAHSVRRTLRLVLHYGRAVQQVIS